VHRFVSLIVSLALVTGSLAEAPFNLDQTPGKLPKDVVPERYEIAIAPSIEKASFTGSVTIDLKGPQSGERARPQFAGAEHSLSIPGGWCTDFP
jgi:hypothetical protein